MRNIRNDELGITTEIVQQECDRDWLKEWYEHLDVHIKECEISASNMEDSSRIDKYIAYQKILLQQVQYQLAKLKRRNLQRKAEAERDYWMNRAKEFIPQYRWSVEHKMCRTFVEKKGFQNRKLH